MTGSGGTVVSHSGLIGALGTTETHAVLADDFAGTLSVVNSEYRDSDPDFGALIVDSGSSVAEVRALGSTFDCRGLTQCLQTDNQLTNATFDRRMVKVYCGNDDPPPNPMQRNEECLGATPPDAGFRTIPDEVVSSDQSLVDGLAPLSEAEVPFFLGGDQASAQIHVDQVRVNGASTVARFDGAVTALLRDRFEGMALWDDPPGWLDTGSNNSLQPADRFKMYDYFGELFFGTVNWESDPHSHFVRLSATDPGWSAYEYGGRMLMTHVRTGLGATAFSQYDASTPADAYYRLGRRKLGEPFRLNVHPASGPGLSCANDETNLYPEPHTWYRFCMQVISGASETRVRAKVWAQEENEPAGFAIDCDDTRAERLQEGTVGIWSRERGKKFWDDLEVRRLDPSLPPPEGCLTAAP